MPNNSRSAAQMMGLVEESRIGTLLSYEASRLGYKQSFTGWQGKKTRKTSIYEQDTDLADELLLKYGGRNVNLKNLKEHYGSMPDFTWTPDDKSKSHVSIELKTCVSGKVEDDISIFHSAHEFDLLYSMAQGGLCALIIATWHVNGRDVFYYCRLNDKKPSKSYEYGDKYRIRSEKMGSYNLGFKSAFSLYDIFNRVLA